MNFRTNSAIPRNDGLPIVNGKKVQRREKFRSQRKSRLGPRASNDYSVIKTIFQRVSSVVFALTFYFYFIKGKQPSPTGASNIGLATGGSNIGLATAGSNIGLATAGSNSVPEKEQQKAVASIESLEDGYGYPDKCTPKQLADAIRQLPEDDLGFRLWRDASFTKATLRSSYPYNPILMREFYASDQFRLNTKIHSFFGVSVGWNGDAVAIDTLAIGSRDTKYDAKSWNNQLKLTEKQALPPVAMSYSAAGTRPAKVLVIDWKPNSRSVSFETLKETSKYSDDELQLEIVQKAKNSQKGALSTIIKSKMPKVNGAVAADQPIHYMHISSAGALDPLILDSNMDLMKQTRFLHFEYNKDGAWDGANVLSKMLDRLKKEGMVCYFAGKKEIDYGLWRVTDCFLEHYDTRHWASLSCVNVKRDDVKELAERMEKKFLETLTKDHTFPIFYRN